MRWKAWSAFTQESTEKRMRLCKSCIHYFIIIISSVQPVSYYLNIRFRLAFLDFGCHLSDNLWSLFILFYSSESICFKVYGWEFCESCLQWQKHVLQPDKPDGMIHKSMGLMMRFVQTHKLDLDKSPAYYRIQNTPWSYSFWLQSWRNLDNPKFTVQNTPFF